MNDESKVTRGLKLPSGHDLPVPSVPWQLQSAALEAAVNGIVITNRKGEIIWVNPAFTALTGYTAEEVLGENPRVLKSGEHSDDFYTQMWETILAGEAWSGDLINRRKNGELYYEEMTITPVRDENDEISNFIAIKQDVTERKRAEEALQSAYAEMEARVETRTFELRDANRQLERRVTELAIINEIAYAISGALDLDELLELLHRQVSRLMPANSFFVALAESTRSDEAGEALESHRVDVWTVVYLVERGERLPPVRYEMGKGLTGHIIRTRQPILMHKPEDIKAFHRERDLEIIGDLAKSWLGVPLIMRTLPEQEGLAALDLTGAEGRLDKVTGVMAVQDYEQANVYDEDDLALLSTIASQAAVAIDNARLFRRMQEARMESEQRRQLLSERAVQLRTAAEVSRAASSILDLDNLLSSAVELIKERFGLYYVGIFLVDQTGQWAVLRAGTGEAGRVMLERGHKFKLGGTSMIGSCIITGQPRIALDVGEEAVRFDNPLLPATRSEMALLLSSRDRKIGAMTIQDVRPSAFSEEDIAVLQTMADQLAHAIENARLFAQSQTALAERERFAMQLRTAAEISAQMNTILDPEALLQEVIPLIRERFALYHVQVYLLESAPGTSDSGQALVSQVGPGERVVIPLDQEPSLIARAAREAKRGGDQDNFGGRGGGLVVEDVTLNEDFLSSPFLPDTRSEVVVPMMVGRELLGVFDVQHDEPYHFTAEDLDVFNTLAGQFASALQNAWLFEQEVQNLRESEIRLEVSQALAMAQTEDEVLDAIMERAGFYPEACVAILTFDQEAGERIDFDSSLNVCPAATVRRADVCLTDMMRQTVSSLTSSDVCLLPDQFPLLNYASAKEMFVSPNLSRDPQVDQTTREFAKQLGSVSDVEEAVVSVAILPITFGSEWLGIIVTFSNVEGYFDEHKLYFYQSLAEQGAVAFHAAQLRDALRLTQFSVDRGPDSIFWIRPDATLAYVNDTACMALGYSREELLSGNLFPQTFFDIVSGLSPDQWADYQVQVRELSDYRDERFTLETQYRTKDGDLVPVEVIINYLQYGDQAYYCAFARDITERKLAEEAQARLTTLIESTTELVAIAEPEGHLIYINGAGREMLGLKAGEDITTYHISDFHPDWAAELVLDVGIPTALEEDFWSGESAVLADGYQIPVLQSIIVQREPDGTVDYLSTIMRDISDIKIAEEEREQLLADLEAHASKLQTASEVAQAVTSILDPDELFPQVVEFVRERFDYYYVGIFEIDETGQWAVLRAGTGEAGQKMLASGHRLAIGGQSMIGSCIQTREARVAFDVGAEAVRFDNPVLPETRSEMALPLQSHDQVWGAMTIQSTRPSDFSSADIIVLQTVADQLANAIYNVTLLRQREQALRELERAYGRYTRDAWRMYLQEMQRAQSYRYRNRRLETEVVPYTEARESLEKGQPVVTRVRSTSLESHRRDVETAATTGALAVPIRLRGQVLGVLNLRFAGEEISDDMIEVIEDVAGRLGQALENARLLDQTRADAVRDQLLSEVTSHVRRTLDMETVLKTAAEEIRRALDLPEVVIRLGNTSDLGGVNGLDSEEDR